MTSKNVVVLGGGPAAVAAAVEAARGGGAVTLAAEEPVGGRATHASLVPSKALLHAVAHPRAQAGQEPPSMVAIAAEMERAVAAEAAGMARRLEDAGVRVVRGHGRFVARAEVEIAREGKPAITERADAVVIATGSIPWFSPGLFGDRPGPDGEHILAPRHLRSLRSLSRTMLVVGGGATGAELAHAFSALGVEITWLLDEYGILPDFDRELADSLGDVLMERGVKIVHGKRVLRLTRGEAGVLAALDGGRTYSAERAVVAIGRRADTARLGLETVGLVPDPTTGALAVDDRMSTAVAGVLAAGDSAGPPFLASKAAVQGWIAGRTASGRGAAAAGPFVEAVFTAPEVAKVGLTPAAAVTARRTIDVRTISFADSVAGLLAGVGSRPHARGILHLVLDLETSTVLGGTAIGPGAAEVLGPVALAVRVGAHAEVLAALGAASPSWGELGPIAAR